ncbi:unnamed protein product [Owenia fusiformis]|uniref:SOCS box domain-containing protein n=1 Tax=Owenia fusiformis TaxID=6347 RepID=A0A8S4NNN3_OWEFU|nr:unnamed protein product [Owenia fusiformis]
MEEMEASNPSGRSICWVPGPCCDEEPCRECLISNVMSGDMNIVTSMYEWVKDNCKKEVQTQCLEKMLHVGSYKNIPEVVKYIISEGALIDFIPSDENMDFLDNPVLNPPGNPLLFDDRTDIDAGMSPLMLAVVHNNLELVTWLIEKGVSLDIRIEDQTALTCAMNCPDPDMVKLLMEHGADPNKPCFLGTALHRCIECEDKNHEKLAVLLSYDRTDVNAMDKPQQNVKDNNDKRKQSQSIGNENNAEPNNHNQIPILEHGEADNDPVELHNADNIAGNADPQNNNLEAIGDNLEIPHNDDNGGEGGVVVNVNNNGADDNLVNNDDDEHSESGDGETDILLGAIDYENAIPCSPLMFACDGGEEKIVEMLIERGAEVNMISSIQHGPAVTALMNACHAESIPCMELLIKAGADPKITDSNGDTLLIKAACTGNIDIVNYVMKLSDFNVNTANKFGKTALIAATKSYRLKEDLSVMKVLLENKADPNVYSKGNNALFNAFETLKSLDAIKMLVENGANTGLMLGGVVQLIKRSIKNNIFQNQDIINVTRTKDIEIFRFLAKSQSQTCLTAFQQAMDMYLKGTKEEAELVAACHDIPKVLSLQHQCRDAIRLHSFMHFPCVFAHCVDSFDIPVHLKNYIMFKD